MFIFKVIEILQYFFIKKMISDLNMSCQEPLIWFKLYCLSTVLAMSQKLRF